jgi:hypothetical protein
MIGKLPMAYTANPLFRQTSLSQPIFNAKLQQTHGVVIQDKSAAVGERAASGQPERLAVVERAFNKNTNADRSQKQHVHASSFVPLTIHVECMVRDEIERRAANRGGKKPLSLSEVGRPIFKRGLQSDIDMQYGSLIEPIVRKTVQDEMRSLRKFVALCFARIGLDTGQTRAIATNSLGRQPGMTPKLCDTILYKSAETAKENLTRQTPQIAQVLDVYDQFLTKIDREPALHK